MPQSEEIFRVRNIENTIRDIRGEATTQKECITRYTFQALAIAGILWTFTLKVDAGQQSLVSEADGMICCTLVAFLMFMVSRMANHKYHTVNRNLGYELHLNRIKDYFPNEGPEKWSVKMLDVGWEEAMCAARVVQATLFNHIYTDKDIVLPKRIRPDPFLDLRWIRPHWLKPYHLKVDHNPKEYPESENDGKKLYAWYNTKELINSKKDYHPGNYLRNVHFILHGVGLFSIILIWGFYMEAYHITHPDLNNIFPIKHLIPLKTLYFIFFGLFNFLFTVFFLTQMWRQNSFREILESGILSIQSSAVVWRIVTTCHIIGKKFAFNKTKSYMSYTRYTYGLAGEAKENFYRIHKWLGELEACYNDAKKLNRKFDKLFPPNKEPQYFEYLPGHEPKPTGDGEFHED
jgi:hypothetical protein